MIALQIIFWTSLVALVHTYIAYPVLMRMLVRKRRDNSVVFQQSDADLPYLTVIIPVHNEAAVIHEKLSGLLRSDYPTDKLEILVGSDESTDATNDIVHALASAHPNVHLIAFTRRGKPAIVNALVKRASHDILVLTDANVMLDGSTLFEMVKHYKNPDITLVESNMLHRDAKHDGIGHQESAYLRGDAEVKHAEGLLWGTMMGPSGGCYSLRRSAFVPIPENFLVDDFYVNMKVVVNGGRAIYEARAIVHEDVSNNLREEFRRKIRIATGDFQNLSMFLPVLFRFNALSFSFLSHKVLRWLSPILLLAAFASSLTLALVSYSSSSWPHTIYALTSACFIVLFLLPALDWILRRLNMHVFGIRMLAYFCSVNVALLIGLARFMRGVKSGAWRPTERNQ